MRFRTGLPLLTAAVLAGCASPRAADPRPSTAAQPGPATFNIRGLEGVMGRTVRTLTGLLGQPGLDIREGPARKLQFLGPACVLDTYLYPPRGEGEPVVTHIDARLPDGADMDRASCVAALIAQQRTR